MNLQDCIEVMRILQNNKNIANALMTTNALRGRELMQNTVTVMTKIDALGKVLAANAHVPWKW